MSHRITAVARRSLGHRHISSSRVVRAGHAGHEPASGPDPTTTNESFMTPTWRNTAILTTLALIGYTTLPSPPTAPSSPSTDPTYATASAAGMPWLSRLLARATPDARVWTERNENHLRMAMLAADDRLLFQEAERPRIHRLRNPGIFESASPNCVTVGDTIDLSDLVIKGDQTLPAQVGSQK